MRGKQKGRFPKGKHGKNLRFHVKAVRDTVHKKPYLEVTMRLTEEDVNKILLPQILKFLGELKRQRELKSTKKA